MQTVDLTSLKANPTEALRKSQEELVVVLNRGQPEALMVGLASTGMLEFAGVRSAFATALFRDGHLSLARAARVAKLPLPRFSAHLTRLGIPVVQMSAAESERDLETLDEWLNRRDESVR